MQRTVVFPKRVFRVVPGPRICFQMFNCILWRKQIAFIPVIERSVLHMMICLIAHLHFRLLISVLRLNPGPPSVPQWQEDSASWGNTHHSPDLRCQGDIYHQFTTLWIKHLCTLAREERARRDTTPGRLLYSCKIIIKPTFSYIESLTLCIFWIFDWEYLPSGISMTASFVSWLMLRICKNDINIKLQCKGYQGCKKHHYGWIFWYLNWIV